MMKLEVLKYMSNQQAENPPLLFIHGASHNAWCWEEHFLPYFAENGYSSYALSFRGHGASEGHEQLESYGLDHYVEDVVQVMQEIGQKPVLVAHSMGGSVAQRVLQAHPDRVQGVVFLSSAPPNGMAKEWAKIVFTRLPKVFKMYQFNTKKSDYFPEELLFSLETPPEKRAEYVKRLNPESMLAAKDMVKQNIREGSIHHTLPVLVLGSKKDLFFSEKIAEIVGRSYKTNPIIFDDICHDMMLDPKWQKVADSILQFLKNANF